MDNPLSQLMRVRNMSIVWSIAHVSHTRSCGAGLQRITIQVQDNTCLLMCLLMFLLEVRNDQNGKVPIYYDLNVLHTKSLDLECSK